MVQGNEKISPAISVIMAVHNGQEFLKEAIDSILTQSFSNFEFIIVDDFSSDNTKNILKSISDTRIHLITNDTNLGLARSLNKAIPLSKGQYIARMDADDVALKDRLKIQYEVITAKDLDVLGSAVDVFDKNGKQELWEFPENFENIYFKGLFSSPFAHPAVLIKKSLLLNSLYDETCIYAQDYELWSRLLFNKGITKVMNLKAPLLRYRVHEHQMSTHKRKQQLAIRLQIFRKNLNTVLKNNNEYPDDFLLRLLEINHFIKNDQQLLFCFINDVYKSNAFKKKIIDNYVYGIKKRYFFEISSNKYQYLLYSLLNRLL